MSGVGEMAYTLLLSWMRGLVDWVWLIISGKGGNSGWQWFLSNWKVWLILLVVGGLAVDWLMWVVRWRPYRLLTSRFSRKKKETQEAWDTGVGFYDTEIPGDSEPLDWTELTMSTLSEVDPDWAEGLKIATEESGAYYAETYDEPQGWQQEAAVDSDGYWEETPDELPYADGAEPAANFYAEEDDGGEYSAPATYDEPAPGNAQDFYESEEETVYDAGTPYESPASDSAYDLSAEPTLREEVAPYFTDDDTPQEAAESDEDAVQSEVPAYGRPGYWPGRLPLAQAEPESAPDNETLSADAEEDISTHRRRRRGQHAQQASSPEWTDWAENETPDARPERLVQPETPAANPIAPKDTGKKRRKGIFRFTQEEEYIMGIPPMDVEDPFLPAAKPENPDFTPDDGAENEPR